MILEALQNTLGDLADGFALAFIGAALACFLVWLEARRERRLKLAAERPYRREWIVVPKSYGVMGGGRRGPGS